MVGDTKPVPLSPRQSQIGAAALQWACCRRGRVSVASVVLLFVFLGIAGARHSEVSLFAMRDMAYQDSANSRHAVRQSTCGVTVC
jgi:hypothetical protein